MTKVVVIGGGAGGILAAGRAAECGAKVILLERNGQLGKKLRITGKGRGNVTNTAEIKDMVAAFGENGKFLYGALSRFSNQDLVNLFERLGVPTKVERGGRVFPASDRATDVVEAIEKWLVGLKVEIRPGVRVQSLVVTSNTEHQTQNTSISGVKTFSGVIPADAVILATGGITYPKTGSTGDGYEMARMVGHRIVPPTPSLSALEIEEGWASELQGLSLKNVSATLFSNGKKVAQEFGEMLFTHFGVSGPIILTLSKTYARLAKKSNVELTINLKPALNREQLEDRLLSDFTQTKQFKNYLPELLPRSLVPVFIRLSRTSPDVQLNLITAPQRKRMLDMLFGLRMTVKGARAADEAIVTAGGIPIKEIDPRTMESKIVHGLYFCGEVIDEDAVTGGYNLQAAFSTGWVAGESAANP